MTKKITPMDEIKEGLSIASLFGKVEYRIKNLTYDEIQNYIRNMQPQHREHFERFVREQDHEMIGQTIMFCIHQFVQSEVQQ